MRYIIDLDNMILRFDDGIPVPIRIDPAEAQSLGAIILRIQERHLASLKQKKGGKVQR